MKILDAIIRFINSYASNTHQTYIAFYILGFLTIFIFNVFYAQKFNIKKCTAFLVTVISYLLIFFWAFVLAWVESLFTDWGHHNAVRVYIWMPVLLFVLSRPCKLKWETLCDFIAPSTCIVYGIARLGCLFPGCCYGIPCEWGIFSQSANQMVFPVQFFEAITALFLAFLVLQLNKKKNYNSDSRSYFIMLIPYGLSRFIWEFFADNEKLFLNISSLALHALLMSAIGAVMLIVLDQKKNRQIRKQAKKTSKF